MSESRLVKSEKIEDIQKFIAEKKKIEEETKKKIENLINKYGLSDSEDEIKIESITTSKSIYGISHSVTFKPKVEPKKEYPIPVYKEEDRAYYQSGPGSCSL